MTREVVVTGAGAVTPLGPSVADSWDALLDGESGAGRVERVDAEAADLRSQVACEVAWDPADHPAVDDRTMGRYAQLCLPAAVEAVEDAGLDPDGWTPERVGVSVATGVGGLPETTAAAGERPNPYHSVRSLPNLAAGHVSIHLDARGPNRSPSTACAAGSHAVIDAARDVAAGRADVMVAGGTEAGLSPVGIGQFDAMRALSTRNDAPAAASRPFDADRDGFVVAEGAGIVVLEAREHARERGATPYASVTGAAMTGDAHHPTQPPDDARGLRRCVRRALDDADRTPGDVDWVCAHATSTPRGDAHEATALREVFDAVPPTTSVKGHTGHPLGAAGAIEAAFVARALDAGVVPPTRNYETPDSDCDLPVVTRPRELAPEVAVSNSAGFGGTNGVLVFEREPGDTEVGA